MRRALLLGLLLACGRPEDALSLFGRVTGETRKDPAGVPVTLYRDHGATETGCTDFSPWRQLQAGDGGLLQVDYLREEITGRYALNRCLRLEWSNGESTASLSWIARDRDTQLPDLMTWWDVPHFPTTPSLPTTTGSVTPQVMSFEAKDARGVVFRQAVTSGQELTLLDTGFAPARDAGLTTRFLQRGQQEQADAIATQPLLLFEYRVQSTVPGFSGNPAWEEVGHGAQCDVAQAGGTACALTDGLFTPVNLGKDLVEIRLAQPTRVSTVVFHGLGALGAFNYILLDGNTSDGGFWAIPSQNIDVESELIATASIEDERMMLYEIVPLTGVTEPITSVRFRLQSNVGAVPVGWLSELSLYGAR